MSEVSNGQAVVIGGTMGLGKAVVGQFLARGLHVTIVSRRPPAASEPTGTLRHVAADLEAMTKADDIVAQVVTGGPIRYLAFCQRYRGTGDVWQGELQVSVTATRILIDGFAGSFDSSHDRAIVVASSVYANFTGSTQPDAYHVAKAGLNQLVRYNARVLGRRGIRINAIMPLTYMKPESRAFYQSEPQTGFYERLVPLGRVGDVADSANLMDFLCSEKASFITGQTIYVDGGVSALWPEEVARRFSER